MSCTTCMKRSCVHQTEPLPPLTSRMIVSFSRLVETSYHPPGPIRRRIRRIFLPRRRSLAGKWLERSLTYFRPALSLECPRVHVRSKDRSGNAAKRHLWWRMWLILVTTAGILNLHNVGNERQFVEKNMKIAQLVMLPVGTSVRLSV